MTAQLPTFEVDKRGLAKLLERRGKPFAITELIQNAWDEASTRVEVYLRRDPDQEGHAILTVEDDNPEGFKNLAHAYTLFAESDKKDNPEQRGRFNLGEKLVIAICDTATITTTKGQVTFTDDGRAHQPSITRERGSEFQGFLRMTDEELEQSLDVARTLIAPEGVTTFLNGEALVARNPVRTFKTSLQTERGDDDGYLRKTERVAEVRLFEPLPGEQASVYELGIPVVETGDRWHYDVQQKVPLTTDRDNVPPAFLRDVRAEVVNHASDLLGPESVGEKWVDTALESPRIDTDATVAVVKGRFGDKVVAYDPSDPEANNLAVAAGYHVVQGGALSRKAWDAVRSAGAILPAGRVTPSDPEDRVDEETLMEQDHWPESVDAVADYVKRIGKHLLGVDVEVRLANDPTATTLASYARLNAGRGRLTFNYGRLGHRFFWDALADDGVPGAGLDRSAPGVGHSVNSLLIHEFAHHECSNHLDHEFHRECCCLGARLVRIALDNPELFVVEIPQEATA